MNRRSFLTFLGLAPVAPKVAAAALMAPAVDPWAELLDAMRRVSLNPPTRVVWYVNRSTYKMLLRVQEEFTEELHERRLGFDL